MDNESNPVVAHDVNLPDAPKVWPVALLSLVAVGLGVAGVAQGIHTSAQQAQTDKKINANVVKVIAVANLQCSSVRLRQEIAPSTPLDVALKAATARLAPQCLAPSTAP